MIENKQHGISFAGFAITFIGAVLFSTKAIIVKKAFHDTHIDALSLLTIRMIFSLPFYMGVAFFAGNQKDNVHFTRRQWLQIIILGLFGYYISSFLDFAGLQYVSAGLERLILFLYPTFTVIINATVFKQTISRVQLLALLLTYTGIAIAYAGQLQVEVATAPFMLGSLLIFLCAITYAIYIVGSGRLHSGTAYWGYGILLAVLATVLPTFLISFGMNRIGSNNVAIVSGIGPVSTILQAHFILGEKIFPAQIAGTLLVITGVLLIGWKSRPALL